MDRILCFGFAVVLSISADLSFAKTKSQNTPEIACKKMVEESATEAKKVQSFTNFEYFSQYSKKYDACFYFKKQVIGNMFLILELTENLIKDPNVNVVLDCNNDGASSLRVSGVKKYKGMVFKVPYEEYLDDGYGGPSKFVKTPKVQFDKKKCEALFEKWRKDLK